MLGLIELIRYYMACHESEGHTDYSFVFHHCDVEETSSVPTSALTLGDGFFPLIKINPKYVTERTDKSSQLKIRWGIEVMKHCLNHLLCGHAETRVQNLVSIYGDKVVQAAADLIINKYADEAVWKQVDEKLVTPKSLGMPDDETLEYYITKLLGEDQANWPTPTGQFNPEFSQTDIANFTDEAQVMEKLRGTMPSEAEEYITQLKKPPQVDWDYFVRQKEGRHRGMIRVLDKKKLSRRCDFHFGRKTISSLNVMFVIDTSGSMQPKDLEVVEPEVDGLAERGANIMIMHCDAAVHKVFPYERGMELGEFFGRGGTDFNPAFDRIVELAESGEFITDFVVFFTDGYGVAPAKEPLDTLWVMTKDGMEVDAFKSGVATWGTVCKLRDNDCPSVAA